MLKGALENRGRLFSVKTNTPQYVLLTGYANDQYKDGSGTAQNILSFVADIPFTEPRMFSGVGGAKVAAAGPDNPIKVEKRIRVYPNPAQNAVRLVYYGVDEGVASVELKDLLGKLIYSIEIAGNSENSVPFNYCENCACIITVTKNKVLLFKTKLIKQEWNFE